MSVNVKSFSKAKSSSGNVGGGGSRTTNLKVADVAKRLSETHTIWGNNFNGTLNVEGDLVIKDANLTVGGTSTLKGKVEAQSYVKCDGNVDVSGNIASEGSIASNLDLSTKSNLSVEGESTLNGKVVAKGDLDVSGTANLKGNTNVGKALTVTGNTILEKELKVKGNTTLNSLNVNNATNLNTLKVANKATFYSDATFNKDISVIGTAYLNNLEVTGEAHFYNLIIDEVKSVGGQIVVSCANGLIQSLGGTLKYTAYGIEEEFELQYFDAEGNEMLDPIDITELRIVRKSGGTIASTWKAFIDNVLSGIGGYIDDDGKVYFTADIYSSEPYNSGTDSLSLYYGNKEIWTFDDGEGGGEIELEKALSEAMAKTYYFGASFDSEYLSGIKEYDAKKTLDNIICRRVKWKAETHNLFVKGDLVLCHKFSVGATTATSKHYWTLCVASGEENGYNYIDLLTGITQSGVTKKEINGSTVIPEVDDNLVQLGNATDTTRQNALVFSAYAENVLDSRQSASTALKAPYMAQYEGINDYSLVGHASNYFSNGKNQIQGDLKVSSGKTVEELISSAIDSGKTYVYTAFCNNPTTGDGFTIKPFANIQYNYMSVITSILEELPTDFASYKDWFSISGTETDITQYRLIPVDTTAIVSTSNNLVAKMEYQILAILGVAATTVTTVEGHTVTIRAKGNASTDWVYLTVDNNAFKGTMTVAEFNKRTDTFILVELLIDNNLISSDTIPIEMEIGAYFEVSDKITAAVTDIDGNKSLIELNANKITQEITDREGAVSSVDQKVDSLTTTVKNNKSDLESKIEQTEKNINLTVGNIEDALGKTGINIELKTITITTDKFYLNNNDGERVLDVDKEGNLLLTGIVKPKNIQLECKEFSDTASDDPNMSTDDIYLAYIQKNVSGTLVNATLKTLSLYTLQRVMIGGFSTGTTGKYKVAVTASGGDVETFNWLFYDKDGNQLADPTDIYELRITRSKGTDLASWKKYFQWVVSLIEYATVTETETGIEVRLDPETTGTVTTGNTVSFYYVSSSEGAEIWNFNYFGAFSYADEMWANSQTQPTVAELSLARATEFQYSSTNTGKKILSSTLVNRKGNKFTILATVNEVDEAAKYGFTDIVVYLLNSDGEEVVVTYNINRLEIDSFSAINSITETKDANVSAFNVARTNYKHTYISYSTNEGKYRFKVAYNNIFWQRNNLLIYYYQLWKYCSGIYDFTTNVKPYETGAYNSSGLWVTNISDKGKKIGAVFVLPDITTETRKDFLGIEITIIANADCNVYLATYTGGVNLYYYNNTYWAMTKLFDYSYCTLTDLYKIKGGTTKVVCVPDGSDSAKWVIE